MAWGIAAKRAASALLTLAIAACIAAVAPTTSQASAVATASNDGVLKSEQVTLQTAAKDSYKIVFKANGGMGSMSTQTVARGKVTTIKANKFTQSGYKFAGWNTKANGKGKSYKDKAKVKNLAKAGKSVTLYAQWKKNADVAYVKVDSASFGSRSVSGAEFSVLYGARVYRIVMTEGGVAKTLATNTGYQCITNGRYLFYTQQLGTMQYDADLSYSVEKSAVYRLDLKTNKRVKYATGPDLRVYGCNGKYLYYGPYKGLHGGNLYAMNLTTRKKRLMASGIRDATYSSGYVVTSPHHNMGINLPVYSFRADGTGKLKIATAMDVRVLGSQVYYIVIKDGNGMQYRKYSCTLRGKSKRAETPWGAFQDVSFSHDPTQP